MEILPLPDYSIYVGSIWNVLKEFLDNNRYSKVIVIADTNTREHCYPLLNQHSGSAFELITVPAGEQHKNLDSCRMIWQQMMDLQLNRNAVTLNLGGGVIGDMGGFCAATFKRGIDFIQIPTTLLSQVDASIGGKLGIDFGPVKNSVGLFKNPKAVFIDPLFLNTLSPGEIRSGFAEIIKHSLIADKDEWEKIKALRDLSAVDWPEFILPSLKIKKQIVEADPFEKGLRKALNFGHTIGHALEGFALTSDHPLLHGEAVAIGMICEAFLSHKQLGMPAPTLDAISRFILSIYGHWTIPMEALPEFIHLMQNDKKNETRDINFSLLPAVGAVEVNQTASEELIRQSMLYYNGLSS